MSFPIDKTVTIAVIGLLTSVCSYLFGHRQQKVNCKSIELKNVYDAIKIWRETAEQQAIEIIDLKFCIDELREQIRIIKEKNAMSCCECFYKKWYVDRQVTNN